MKWYLLLIFPFFISAQTEVTFAENDSLFREDQFYMGFTYNLLQKKPSTFSQNGFSSGLTLGFLRDMPINKKRTWAIAAGLGYSYNNLKQNIRIDKTPNGYSYSTIVGGFTKNNLVLHYLEVPLEIRWRNAKPDNHKFTRIYTGFKMNYLIGSKSNFVSETEKVVVKNNSTLQKIVVGPYIAIGYNTINLYAFYAINPITKNQTIVTQNLELNTFNFGFQFYIL